VTSRLRRTVFDRSKEKRHFLCNTFKSSDFLIDRSSSSLHSATGLPHSIAFVPTLSLANAKELHIIRWLRSSWLPWCPEIYSSEDVSHFGEQKLLLARGQVSNWKGVCRYATLGMARDVVLKEPLSLHQKCGFKHGIRSNNLSSACKSNSFFTPPLPPSGTNSLWITSCILIKAQERTDPRLFHAEILASVMMKFHSTPWSFVSGSYWNIQFSSPVILQLRKCRLVWMKCVQVVHRQFFCSSLRLCGADSVQMFLFPNSHEESDELSSGLCAVRPSSGLRQFFGHQFRIFCSCFVFQADDTWLLRRLHGPRIPLWIW